jgi:hypothetical protein
MSRVTLFSAIHQMVTMSKRASTTRETPVGAAGVFDADPAHADFPQNPEAMIRSPRTTSRRSSGGTAREQSLGRARRSGRTGGTTQTDNTDLFDIHG